MKFHAYTMTRHKRRLCESFCPKQVFLSSFAKEVSWAIVLRVCLSIYLSSQQLFNRLTTSSSLCTLGVLQLYQFHRNRQLCKRRWGKRYRCIILFSDTQLIPLLKAFPLYKRVESLDPSNPGTASQAQGSQQQRSHSCPCSPLPHQCPHHPWFPWGPPHHYSDTWRGTQLPQADLGLVVPTNRCLP